MTRYQVALDGPLLTGSIQEAADETAAVAQMREDLKDWADQVDLICEEIWEKPAKKKPDIHEWSSEWKPNPSPNAAFPPKAKEKRK